MKFKGTPAEKKVLMKFLLKAATLDFKSVLFTYPEPLPDEPVGSNYIGRLLFVLDGKINIFGSNGKILLPREVTPDKVVYTGEHCWAGIEYEGYSGTTISVIVMTDYFRIIAVEFKNGEFVTRPYYHTSTPPGDKSLSMNRALNHLVYDKTPERMLKTCLLIRALLLEAIDEIRKDKPHPVTKAEQTYKIIRDYIDHNYERPINRNDICHELGFNPCYVSRLFRKYNGDKINNYLEQCRMKKARLMLKNFNITIARVATQCGYSSEAYFIKAFKKFYNITPGEFRNKNLAE